MATYRIKRGDTLSGIARRHDMTLNQLLAVNPRYKSDPGNIQVGDELAIPTSRERPGALPLALETATEAPGVADADDAGDDPFSVPVGQLTFDAEGSERRGRYFSRCLHVPGAWSGATIGRGYDMKHRSRDAVRHDLVAAGVPRALANKLSACAGYSGSAAKAFIRDNDLGTLEISPRAQKRLFLLTYEEISGDVRRICAKADVVERYGATDWDGMKPIIRDVLVDLRYRGDYTGATRVKVQPAVVANSLSRLARLMASSSYWMGVCNVPEDRFERRRRYTRD